MAAGLRVHVARPRAASSGRGIIIPLFERNPERLPPPDLVGQEPTPLEPESRRQPIIIDPMPPASQFRVAWSFLQILRYLLRWLRLKVTGRLDEQQHAVRTRQLLERLSGIWIKVGQLLSLRTDLISDVMARELSALHYQARGFPPEIARSVIEDDLQRPLSAVFAHFEMAPLAAASIAQVHRATLLRNNRAVVVKVMRPDVARSFARDLRLLEAVVRWINRFGLLRRFNVSEGLAELRAILNEETNYQYELVNLQRMRRSLLNHDVYVPRAVKDLCRQRVLVLEEVPGVLMSQYTELRHADPERVNRWALMNGIDPRTLARNLSITLLRQILEDNEFHGDLHPGNIMLLADSRIALIDFGSVGRLNQRIWFLYRNALAAMAMRDYARAADMMLMMSPSLGAANSRAVRRDMTAALNEWEFASQFTTGSYADRSLAAMANMVARVMASHGVPLNWGIMRVGRSLSTLDSSLQALVPNASFMSLSRAYFRDRQRRAGTLQGRRAALRTTMAQIAGLATDAHLLLGDGIRDQALRLNGMLNTVGRVRVILLTFMQRVLQIGLFLVLQDFLIDTYLQYVGFDESVPHLHFLHFIDDAIPNFHPAVLVVVVVLTWLLLRSIRKIHNAIVRVE